MAVFKRMALCLTAMLALPFAARAAECLCVVAPGMAALTDVMGNPLIEGDEISEVFSVREGALYAAGRRGDYALYDASGAPLSEERFSMIADEGDCLIFCRDGAYGAMDAAGNVLLAPEWTQLTSGGASGWLALDSDPLDDRADEIICLDGSGPPRRTGVYTLSGLERIQDDRMPYMAADGRYGAVNGQADAVLEATWRYMGAFSGGLARVSGPEGVGVIDAEGRVIIPPAYQWLERSTAMIAACDARGLHVFSPDGGELRFSLPCDSAEVALVGDCVSVAEAERTRLYDAQGALVAEGGAGTRYAPGLRGQVIASDGAWGEACQWLINPDGSDASGRFQLIVPLCEGRYAWLEMEGSEYYSADLGAVRKSWNYDSARYGLMDEAGHILAGAECLEIRAVGADRLLLIGEEEVRLTDLNGAPVRTWITAEGEAASSGTGA